MFSFRHLHWPLVRCRLASARYFSGPMLPFPWLKPCLLPAQKHVGWLLCPALTAIVQVMIVLMHNTREVPAEWQVKPPVDLAAAADWSYFKCEPEQGLLPPGQKQLLKVCPTVLLTR